MEQLALRDIHLPPAVDWWPLAPLWWLLLIGVPLTVIATMYLYRRLTRKTAIKTARKRLQAWREDNQAGNAQRLAELSILLRRVALSTGRRQEIASLHGEAWLNYLDRQLPNRPFSQGVGRCLAEGAYQKHPTNNIDFDALYAVCLDWLKRQ